MTVVISASALSKFFECPRKYQLSRQWRSKDESGFFLHGSQAHEMMEKGGPIEGATEEALAYYEQLAKAEKTMGYQVAENGRENKEFFSYVLPSGKEVKISRIIDVYATDNQGTLVVDYKTSGKGWNMVGHVYPQACGFQGEIYLIPSPTSPIKVDEKTRFVFLVATPNSFFTTAHLSTPQTRKDLHDAMEIFVENVEQERYPAVRGYGCRFCEYAPVCYQTPGYEYDFERKS